jgi:hypothetical protein
LVKEGSRHTCARNEAQGIVSRLRVLPEMDVGVVEDVGVDVQIVEGLGGEHHADVIAPVEEGHRLIVKVGVG